MAKLTALSNLAKAQIANSGATELSVMVGVDKINYDQDFQNLFPLDEILIAKISESIKENGFDKSQPLHLLREGNILIDGHNRLRAAKEAGLYEVPVFYHNFAEKNEALEYAILLQTNRRNLNDAQLFDVIEHLDKLKNPGIQTTDTPKGKSAELLAQKIGTSRSKVEKVRAIKNKGDDETIEAVKSGELSINAGYNAVRQKETEPENNFDIDYEEIEIIEPDIQFDKIETPATKSKTHEEIQSAISSIKNVGSALFGEKPINPKIAGQNILTALEKITKYLKNMEK